MTEPVCIGDATLGRFQLGQEPWNKGIKGIHLSPRTEFKKGCASFKKLPIGSITVRHRKREKTPRAWIKIAEPNRWRELAKVVWEKEYGSIPHGVVIHHKDRNTLNDDLDNLEPMTRAEHLREHRADLLRGKNAA